MSKSVVESNVIPVEFRAVPVIVSFDEASTPKGEIALRIAAEAAQQTVKLGSSNKKAGTIRLLSTGRSDSFMVNPYLLRIKDGWNSRDLSDPANVAHIDTTARSIAEIGVQQTLTVTLEGETMFVTDGHIRLLATLRAIEVYGAEIKAVPVQAEGRFKSEADRTLSQIVRNSGKPLTVLERGAVYVKLIAFGWSVEQIAAKVGVGPARVTQVLDLMAGATEGIKAFVASGKTEAATAALALKHAGGDSAEAERALDEAYEAVLASGKTKVTPKNLKAARAPVAKVSKVATLRAIFGDLAPDVDADGTVRIRVSQVNWTEIKRLLDL